MTPEEKLELQRGKAAKAREALAKARRQPSAFSRLTPRQRLFVLAYAKHGCNGVKAAMAAGYSPGKYNSAAVTASTLLKNTKIAAAIKEQFHATMASAEAVVARISEAAFNDTMEFIGHDGQLSLEKLREAGHLVEEFDASQGLDKARVKFISKERALAMMGKIHNIFVERHEVTGPMGGPVVQELRLSAAQAAATAPRLPAPQQQPTKQENQDKC